MEPIIPFLPSDAERQHPIAQDYQNKAGNLATANLQEDPNTRGRSGSRWGIKEATAVRAVPLLDLDPRRIVPANYFPTDDNEVFRSLYKQIRAAQIDDIKEFDADKYQDNKYIGFFSYLSQLSTTNTSKDSVIRAHRRNTSSSSVTTELSTSSNEDSKESVSTAALRDFVSSTVLHMGGFKNLHVSVGEGIRAPYLLCSADEIRFKFALGGVSHDAINDGQVAVNFPGSVSRSDRSSYLSVISLECKPRNAAC